MKKYIITLVCIVLFPVTFSSCLESYLDKSPESGLVTDDVFKKLDNFKKFFRAVYEGRELDGTTWRDYNIRMGTHISTQCQFPVLKPMIRPLHMSSQ